MNAIYTGFDCNVLNGSCPTCCGPRSSLGRLQPDGDGLQPLDQRRQLLRGHLVDRFFFLQGREIGALLIWKQRERETRSFNEEKNKDYWTAKCVVFT